MKIWIVRYQWQHLPDSGYTGTGYLTFEVKAKDIEGARRKGRILARKQKPCSCIGIRLIEAMVKS